MLNRTFLFGVFLFSTTTVFSGTLGSPTFDAEPYHGFYLGADIGIANLMDKESTLYAPGLYDIHQFSSTGLIGGGLLGYDYLITDHLQLGLEGFINGTALNIAAEQQYGSHPSFNANMRYNAGLRILPGYQFYQNVVGQVILGYAYGKFNIKDNGNYGFINTGLSNNGFQAGLGMKVPFYFTNVSLRGGLIYTTYGSTSALGLSNQLVPQNYNNQFSTIEGNISLIYQF